MGREVIQLYSTPLYHENTNFYLNPEELNFIFNIKYKTRDKENDVFISKSHNILNNKKLNRIKIFLNEKINFFIKNILEINNKVRLTQSWIAKTISNSKHHSHCHKGAFLSCVFYVNCKSGHFIINEHKSALQNGYNFDYNVIQYNSFNSEMFYREVKTNDLIIFPGHLTHETKINKSDEDRIVIGANYFLKDKIGVEKNITYLKI
jgi:uncharacterized protein (TIGR02466 family)|tara:strand:- start:263 stop:880 length:618 start_codon:yes stop_codon:yes gene_type:complete